MGIVGLMTGAGAGAGIQEILKQRILEREMALREQAQRAQEQQGTAALDVRRNELDEARNYRNDQAAATDLYREGMAVSRVAGETPFETTLAPGNKFKAWGYPTKVGVESVEDLPIPGDVAVEQSAWNKPVPSVRQQGPLKLMGPNKKPVFRTPSEAELQAGVEAYDEPNQGPRPYFMPVTAIPGGQTTPQVYVLDARTGQLVPAQTPGQPGPMQPRLSGTEQTKTNEVATAIKSGEMIRAAYFSGPQGAPRRDFIGPATGRWTTLKSMMPETGVTQIPQGWATFAATVANNKNATIKAITGAQMSEAETKRLIKQIPDIPDRPEMFEAKLQMMGELNAYVFARWARAEQMRAQGIPPKTIESDLDREMGLAPGGGGKPKMTIVEIKDE